MSQRLPIRKTLRFFTMVELIAVMAVAGVIITISMKLAVPDPTKTNATIINAALSFAQSHSLGKLFDDDEFIQVHMDFTNKKININKFNDSADNTVDEFLKEYNIRNGSIYSLSDDYNSPVTDAYFYFNKRGEPLTADPVVTNIDTNDLEFQSSALDIYTFHKDEPNNKVPVFIKPFTGKVAFY